MGKKKWLWNGLACLCAFLLVIFSLVSILLESYATTVDSVLGTTSEKLTSEDDGTLYSTFVPDEEFLVRDAAGNITGGNSKALLKASIQLGRRQSYEGSVLLKNNGALPLSKGSNVTLLGKRTHVPLLGSSMGVKAEGQLITLETALGGDSTDFANEFTSSSSKTFSSANMDDFAFSELNIEGRTDGAGAGFNLNPAMVARYEALVNGDYSATYNDGVITGNAWAGEPSVPADPNEPGVDEIDDVSLEGYKDAAIVMISRGNQESGDYMPGEVAEGVGADEPLQLTANEQAIIDYACDNFEKVILLLNVNNSVEIKHLAENDEIDAILWVGHPGCYGCLGIADILCGRVSPSGGLADIFAADNLSAPAMQNMGTFTYSNADEITRTSQSGGKNYLIEAEGIYVGYRYYETRYYDSVYGQGDADSEVGAYASTAGWNYEEEVTYGFGYGLTYTDFDFEIVDVREEKAAHEWYFDIDVKVTNTGDAASATPVQIYGQAPYIHGVTEVEKPAVQLLEFGKTGVIEKGKSETVTITVDMQNLASYDGNYENADGSVGTYILDEGDYYFAVGNGAHDALNNILAKQGKSTGDGMDYNGDADLAYLYTYDYSGTGTVDANTFAISKSNTRVENQIPYADWNYYEGASKVTYLSRSDWAGTYPVSYTDLEAPDSMLEYLNGNYYEVATGEDTSSIVWGQEGDLQFYQLSLVDFDDPRWEELLNQLTMEESIVLAAYGGTKLPGADSIGLVERESCENTGNGIQNYSPASALVKDASWYIGEDDPNGNMALNSFGFAPLIASSYSHDLMYETGRLIGNHALFVGLPILWAPAQILTVMPITAVMPSTIRKTLFLPVSAQWNLP